MFGVIWGRLYESRHNRTSNTYDALDRMAQFPFSHEWVHSKKISQNRHTGPVPPKNVEKCEFVDDFGYPT